MNLRFGPFMLDLETRQLARGHREIHLSPKAFDLLRILIADRPRVLSKAVLQERLWPGTFVAEANLSNLVAEVRGALGDPARTPRFIRTAHRFGYSFCADATDLPGTHSFGKDRPSFWLAWGTRRIPLGEGEHVVGRDPDVEVRLEASSVSRRHARILVAAAKAALEDLASKNGTFRNGERLTSPARLADGDAIRFGSVLLTFHARGPVSSTETQAQPVT